MKSISYSFLALLTIACAGPQLSSKISDKNKDIFTNESFLRYTPDRLEKLKDTRYSAVAKCHYGKITKGLDELKINLEKQKLNPEYWNQVGMCFFLSSKDSKAEYYFKKALAIDEDFPPAINNIAILRIKNRSYDEALSLLEKAQNSQIGSLVSLFNQSHIFLLFNQTDIALKILNRLHRKNSSDYDVLAGLAMANIQKNNIKLALKYFNNIPLHLRNRIDISIGNALSLYLEKKFFKAKDLLEKSDFTTYLPLKRTKQKLHQLIMKEIKRIEQEEKAKAEKVAQR